MNTNRKLMAVAIGIVLWGAVSVGARAESSEKTADLDPFIAAQKDASGKTSEFKKERMSLIQKMEKTDKADRLKNGNPVLNLTGYGCESFNRAVKETQVLREVMSAFIDAPDSQGRYPLKTKAEVLLSGEKAETVKILYLPKIGEILQQEHVKNGVKLFYSVDPEDWNRSQDLSTMFILLDHGVGRRYRLIEYCSENNPFLEETKQWGCGTKVLHTNSGFVASILNEELCQ